MTSLRLWLILAVVVASAWIYFFNVEFIAVRLREFIITTVQDDAEFWEHYGLESQSKLVIRPDPHGVGLDDMQAYRSNLLIRRRHNVTDLQIPPINLDINTSDVLVIIHIQKTGGTYLEDNLAYNTNIQPPVLCKQMPGVAYRLMCSCLNANGQDWMLNRHCTGWACGLHPGLMELESCVDQWFSSQINENRKRNYHYITMIRDPVTRFMSEWLHVRRGATWKESRLYCDGKDASLEEVPFCFKRGSWKKVSFDDFVNCPSNMAINRQTRMLANLSLSDCFRLQSNLTQEKRNEIMLQSAKVNLAKFITFFGILEHVEESQTLFEKTFVGLQFTKKFLIKTSYSSNYAVMSESHWVRAVEKNHLDIQLYQYAKDLFLQRLQMANITLQGQTNEAVIVPENFKYIIVPAN